MALLIIAIYIQLHLDYDTKSISRLDVYIP